jgi:PKD repeat protein
VRLRSIVTALLLVAGVALGLLPAAAHASGPGVTLFVNTIPRPIDIPGSRFSGGVSIDSLIRSVGVDPASVTFVNVTRVDAGQVALTQGEFGAVIIDNGTSTRFVSGSDRVTATADTGPLQISINGGDMTVVASASPRRIEANQSVTFNARVRFAPPGATLSFEWDFNDGTAPVSGRSVTHTYKFGGEYQARVTVTGQSGSTGRCATECVGTDDVDVSVGEPPPPPPPQPPGAGGTGGGSGTGSGGGSGTGTGSGTGAGTGTGSDPAGAQQPAKPKAKPKPKPKPKKKPFGVTISGVLIDDPGAIVSKLPSGTAPGGPGGTPRRPSDDSDGRGIEIPLTGLFALACISLGALRERRGVRLRLA